MLGDRQLRDPDSCPSCEPSLDTPESCSDLGALCHYCTETAVSVRCLDDGSGPVWTYAGEPDGCLGSTEPATYTAVFIEADDPNCGAEAGSIGTDIDAIGLFDAKGSVVAYLDDVSANDANLCADNPNGGATEALGPPDASATEGSLSLHGGKVLGTFENGFAVGATDTITVFEVDEGHGAGAAGYTVWLLTDWSCADGAMPDPSAPSSWAEAAVRLVSVDRLEEDSTD